MTLKLFVEKNVKNKKHKKLKKKKEQLRAAVTHRVPSHLTVSDLRLTLEKAAAYRYLEHLVFSPLRVNKSDLL